MKSTLGKTVLMVLTLVALMAGPTFAQRNAAQVLTRVEQQVAANPQNAAAIVKRAIRNNPGLAAQIVSTAIEEGADPVAMVSVAVQAAPRQAAAIVSAAVEAGGDNINIAEVVAAAVAEALRGFRVVEMAQAALPHHAPAAQHPQLTKAYERLVHHVQTLAAALR